MDVELIDARAYADANTQSRQIVTVKSTKIITLAKAHVKTRTLTIGQWLKGQRQHVSIFRSQVIQNTHATCKPS